jgi:hypothetical protein
MAVKNIRVIKVQLLQRSFTAIPKSLDFDVTFASLLTTHDRHPLHATHDGFTRTSEGFHGFLDSRLRGNEVALETESCSQVQVAALHYAEIFSRQCLWG